MNYQVTISYFREAIFPIGSFLLLGLGMIGYSIYALLRGQLVSQAQWKKDLITWQVLGPNTLPQTLTDVKRSWDYLLSMAGLGGGIGIVLTMISWAITARVAVDTVETAAMNYNSTSFLSASVFLSFGIGLGISAVFAAWRLRRAARRSITYADLRQRRLSDYRNNAFCWLAGAMIAWTFGVLLFFSPHIGSALQINLLYTVVSVPNTVLGLSIVPGTMLLVFVLAEVILFRIVHFSRLLITSDATVSQHADDMLRAIVIGTVQGCELLALAQLASLAFNSLSPHLWASHYWQIGHLLYLGLLTISWFMPVAIQFLGLGVFVMRGRLGGKLSGWPWQTKHIKQLEGGQ
jgi:hypothetical protein